MVAQQVRRFSIEPLRDLRYPGVVLKHDVYMEAMGMKDIQYLGLWWLPTDERHKVSGTITFSDDTGIKLNLIGSLSQNRHFGAPDRYPTILGQTNSGQFITLRSCLQISHRLTIPGFAVEEIIADEMYVGKHHTTLDLQHFQKAQVTFTYLTQWLAISGFSYQNTNTAEGFPEKVDVQYVFPEPVQVKVFDTSISISHTLNQDTKGHRVNLKESVSITFESQQALTLEQWRNKWLLPFQNFLTFATGQPNRLADISVFSKYSYFTGQNGKKILRPITAYYRQTSAKTTYKEDFSIQDMLFSYHDISDDVQRIFDNWFRVSSNFDTVSSLLFVTQYSLMPYLNPRFLSVSQAVETYNRRKYPNYVMPKERYKSYVRLILRQTVRSQKDWLSKKLEHANEPSLYTRLIQLMNVANEVMAPIVGNTERFARKVADTRNYLTHYNPKNKKKAATELELYWMIETLIVLVQWSMLLELGVSPQKCTALFSDNKHYQSIVRRGTKY